MVKGDGNVWWCLCPLNIAIGEISHVGNFVVYCWRDIGEGGDRGEGGQGGGGEGGEGQGVDFKIGE